MVNRMERKLQDMSKCEPAGSVATWCVQHLTYIKQQGPSSHNNAC